MNHKIATYLSKRATQILAMNNISSPKISIYSSAADMMIGIFGDRWKERVNFYKEYISNNDYKAAFVCDNDKEYYNQIYRQPSLNYEMCLFGFATNPVSVTYEGCGMRDFTFTIFHEISHIINDTLDESVCNKFAALYNHILWNTFKYPVDKPQI